MNIRDHFVYEAYDADGLLLYVGCTGKPRDRYRAHMTGNGDARGWFNPFVTHWRVSGPYEKTVALALEKARILEGQPIWNGVSEENKKDRGLIRAYLRHHGVKFVEGRFTYRPELVPNLKAKKRRLRVVEDGAA